MKTLLVTYLPSGTASHTKQLVDTFLSHTKGQNIETLDLLKNVPDLFGEVSLSAYITRNYQHKPLSPEQTQSIKKMDAMTQQFKSANIVVFAFPMHNFSVPATIKAYFDSVMQKGETWDINPQGFVGLMKGKKALVLTSSGGVYEGQMASWEHAQSLAKTECTFMGFTDFEVISAAGTNLDPSKADQNMTAAKEKVGELVKKWFTYPPS